MKNGLIKLLVHPSGGEFKKPMSNDSSYTKTIKVILFALAIVAYHLVHLGRNLGPKILEMLKEESDCIHQLGNWNPPMQDSSYSTKLPMKPIRKLVGSYGMHNNPLDAFKNIECAVSEQGLPKFTAFNVLKFMVVELNKVFLQDTATMMLKHPERICNPLFRLEVFQSDEFQVSSRGLSWWHLMHLLTYVF
jgi:hypothetical protein